ncbi:MAG: extracellular solute-binding protein [Clostridia bacterium]|nr:extracellular solute-binding protein [Clostridia bacterium]
MLKRKLSFTLAAVMAASSFAGCGGKEAKKDGDTFETAPVVYYAKANSFEAALGKTGDDYKDNDYARYIWEKTGVRVEPIFLSTEAGDQLQQLSTMRAGGTQLDLIVGGDITQSWMQAGIIVEMNDFFEKYADKIEGWSPLEENCIDETGWKVTSKLGHYWGVPGAGDMPASVPRWFYIRQDWLDKLGLQMPKTTEELGNVMKAFTEQDPDGNGIDDTFGMVHRGTSTVNELLITMGVDSYREYTVNKNGDIDPEGKDLVAQAMHPTARAKFARIRDWCQNGYICEDGITDQKAYEKMIVNNKVGIVLDGYSNMKKYSNTLKSNGYTDAQFAFCKEKITDSDDGQFYGFSPAHNSGSVLMFTSMIKEETYDSIIKLLNWMYSEEGTFFQTYGLEGREYSVADGKIVEDEDYLKNKSYLGLYRFGRSYDKYYPDRYDRIFGTDQLAKDYIDAETNHTGEYATERTDIKFEYPDLPEFTTYPDWRKGIESALLTFTVGDKDPMDDSTWNAYIEECKGYGIEHLMDAAEEAHFGKQ